MSSCHLFALGHAEPETGGPSLSFLQLAPFNCDAFRPDKHLRFLRDTFGPLQETMRFLVLSRCAEDRTTVYFCDDHFGLPPDTALIKDCLFRVVQRFLSATKFIVLSTTETGNIEIERLADGPEEVTEKLKQMLVEGALTSTLSLQVVRQEVPNSYE